MPDTTGYREYIYKLTDTLSKGLTMDTGSVKVLIGGEDVTENENVTVIAGANELIVTFNMLNFQDKVGQEIKVTYEASLNEDAVNGVLGNPNEVELEYSNDPQDQTSTDTTTDEEKVHTAAIKVLKFEEGYEDKVLSGAKFVLKNGEGADGTYYKLVDGKITWVDNIEEADEKTTNAEGIVEFKGLKNGTYYLVETEAPEGFNKLTDPIEVTIDYENQTEIEFQEAKVANSTGVELPGTGGAGTTLFAVLGGGIILVAAFCLIKGKSKKERN